MTKQVLVLDDEGEVVLVCNRKDEVPIWYRQTHEILEVHVDD